VVETLTQPEKKAPAGLEDVVAGNTAISTIIEKDATLIYRGYKIEDLAAHANFEEVIYLLWYGKLPNQQQYDQLVAALAANREVPAAVLEKMQSWPPHANSMDALRTAVSMLGLYDPDAGSNDHEANMRKAIRIAAQVPTLVAAYDRISKGQAPVAPRKDLNAASNFLYMLAGEAPNDLRAKVMDTALVLHADHELNASAFACRVTVSTLSDMHSAIVTAIGTLKGPLHGGANQEVMKMLEAIGDPNHADEWVTNALAGKGARVMGFGHRVYKHGDPRAFILKKLSKQLGQQTGDTRWYDISENVEHAMAEKKAIYPNVDFYSASTYHNLGIETSLFIPIFACSRVVGWIAHALEQYADNRIIRPRAEWIGETDLHYVPIGQRS
jgi:citrate synthase